MNSTFWMTAEEAEREIASREWFRERLSQVKYPFADNLQFCEKHDANSPTWEVIPCHDCKLIGR